MTDTHISDGVDIFGEPVVAASPEALAALKTAAQLVVDARTWSLGTTRHELPQVDFVIRSATNEAFWARLTGDEDAEPYLIIAREEAYLVDSFDHPDYVALHVQYEHLRDGSTIASAMHFHGGDEQVLSSREAALVIGILSASSQLGATRSQATHDGLTVSLRDARPIDATSRWRDIGRLLLARMERWAATQRGADQMFERSTEIEQPSLRERAYLFDLRRKTGRTLAEDFRLEVALDDDQRTWLDAAIVAWSSLWTVMSVADGRATLRDMFTREVRIVPDDDLVATTIICARVITLADGAYIDARSAYVLGRDHAAEVRHELAEIMDLPKSKPVRPEALRVPLMALEFAVFWHNQFEDA